MHVRLPPASSSGHAARVAVRRYLSAVGRTDVTDDVLLIANELVANAVMHARTEMQLSVELELEHEHEGVSPSLPARTSGRTGRRRRRPRPRAAGSR